MADCAHVLTVEYRDRGLFIVAVPGRSRVQIFPKLFSRQVRRSASITSQSSVFLRASVPAQKILEGSRSRMLEDRSDMNSPVFYASLASGIFLSIVGCSGSGGLADVGSARSGQANNPSAYLYSDSQAIDRAVPIIKRLATDSDMEAALLKVNVHEGHGFTLAQGEANTKTDDGVTWGLLGFTSFDGDIYNVLEGGLSRMSAADKAELERDGNAILGSRIDSNSKPTDVRAFLVAVDRGKHIGRDGAPIRRRNPADALATWALRVNADGKKTPWTNVQAFFGWLGERPYMIKAQWQAAEGRYNASVNQARRALGGRTPGSISKKLFVDIYTFSGGLDDAGWSQLLAMPWQGEAGRMREAVEIVLRRLGPGNPHYRNCKTRWYSILQEFGNA
ncbi:hypothetical protein KBB96_09095 [Luteolibacter ambystomatis]|uniref:Uncharacterized protein n=1 Tax=Luteolibacter ambystomatis TaxID=2824561 RepID=A0A975PGS7_9BACT|nr:hypothetical protein [Luteolibacter ambystomatis]QUE53033.1 hypothetical protein KBB96_09095 [Luteolibacter ambystomatis]